MKSRKWNKPISGEWASTLYGYIKTLEDKVPEEWKTTEQVMKNFNLVHTRGGGRHAMLMDMCKKGFLESKRFRVLDSTGRRVMLINHYRVVKKSSVSQK